VFVGEQTSLHQQNNRILQKYKDKKNTQRGFEEVGNKDMM
jgi:hypothetical protein